MVIMKTSPANTSIINFTMNTKQMVPIKIPAALEAVGLMNIHPPYTNVSNNISHASLILSSFINLNTA